jgi:cell division protein FtsQ
MIRKWIKGFRKPRARNRARVDRADRALPSIDVAFWLPRAAGAIVAVVGVVGITMALDRPVRQIDAVGVFRRVSLLDVERVVRGKLRGGFVRANISDVQSAVEGLPWVDHARIQRRWPDALMIQITEQEAVARWGDSGLVNARGELFVRDERHVPMELPHLEGPDGTEHRVADLFFQVRTQLEAVSLPVGGVRLDDRGAWEVELANGVTIRLGRREVQERMDRFLKAGAGLVSSRSAEISYIDMRYSNGFSIGWRNSQSRTG